MNPKKLDDINPVTLVSSNQLQILFLNDQRSFTFSHDGENRIGGADTSKIYLYTATSGHPQGIVPNDNESESSQRLQCLDGINTVQSGINVNKLKLISNRNAVTVGPGISTLGYIASGNGNATFLIIPNNKQYGAF